MRLRAGVCAAAFSVCCGGASFVLSARISPLFAHPASSAPAVDAFDQLGPHWSFTDPFPPDASATIKAGWLELAVHGHEYDGWRTANNFATVLQPAPNDPKIAIEAVLDPMVATNGCSGIMVTGASRRDFIRWEIEDRAGEPRLYAATIVAGVATPRGNPGLTSGTDALRITRDGDTWALSARIAGAWNVVVTFTQPLVVGQVGVYAGGHNNAAHTARFDSFTGGAGGDPAPDPGPRPGQPTPLGGVRLFSLKLERDLRAYYAATPPILPLPRGANAPDPLRLAVGRLLIDDIKDEALRLKVLREMVEGN